MYSNRLLIYQQNMIQRLKCKTHKIPVDIEHISHLFVPRELKTQEERFVDNGSQATLTPLPMAHSFNPPPPLSLLLTPLLFTYPTFQTNSTFTLHLQFLQRPLGPRPQPHTHVRRDLPISQERLELLEEQEGRHGRHQFLEMGSSRLRLASDRPGSVSGPDEE